MPWCNSEPFEAFRTWRVVDRCRERARRRGAGRRRCSSCSSVCVRERWRPVGVSSSLAEPLLWASVSVRWMRCWCCEATSTLNRSRCGCSTDFDVRLSADESKKKPDWLESWQPWCCWGDGDCRMASRENWVSANQWKCNSVRDRLWRWPEGRSSCWTSHCSAAGQNTAISGGFPHRRLRLMTKFRADVWATARDSRQSGRGTSDDHRQCGGRGRCFQKTLGWECCSRRKRRRSSCCCCCWDGGWNWPVAVEWWCTCFRWNKRTTRRVCRFYSRWPWSVSCCNPGTCLSH